MLEQEVFEDFLEKFAPAEGEGGCTETPSLLLLIEFRSALLCA